MRYELVQIILLMAVVTYGARVIPFLLFRNKKIGGIAKSFIQLVPVALLAALVLPEFFISPDQQISFYNPYLFAGICTFIIARWVPSMFLSVLFGMLAYWGFDKIV